MKSLNKFTMVVSKIIEVALWVGLAMTVVGLIASCIGLSWVNKQITANEITPEKIESYINEQGAVGDLPVGSIRMLMENNDLFADDGTVRIYIIVLTLTVAMAECGLMAMVFRNIHLVLKTAEKNETPFCADITRMIRDAGIFLVVLAGVELVLHAFGSMIDMNLINLFIGLLLICLSGFFRYGEQLQEQADTLV